MARKEDLECSIRESYRLIHEYEDILRLSADPKEQARARRAVEEQWELIEGYLGEYLPLCQRIGIPLPADIAEIAARFEATTEKRVLPGSSVHIPPGEETEVESGTGPKYEIHFEGPTDGVVIGDSVQVTQRFGASTVGEDDGGLSPAEERAFLERELTQHKRNLYKLREKAAKYGIDVSISVLNQIEDEEREIRHIERELERLRR